MVPSGPWARLLIHLLWSLNSATGVDEAAAPVGAADKASSPARLRKQALRCDFFTFQLLAVLLALGNPKSTERCGTLCLSAMRV
jgi:hypothetical protein